MDKVPYYLFWLLATFLIFSFLVIVFAFAQYNQSNSDSQAAVTEETDDNEIKGILI